MTQILTDEEIRKVDTSEYWFGHTRHEFAREIEKAVMAKLASKQEPTPDNSASLLLHEIFSLCEHTEDAPQVKPKNEHQRGFDAGRRFEAKGIRRAIGDWFQSEFCGGSFMGEPAPAQHSTDASRTARIDTMMRERRHDIKEQP